ncbi:exodeoxyribonuclease VII large subunit [Bifidobacterium pseudolongum subsp. globosum]|jgi:exodeoxyribonuclease VII large subunit|uniref:Exodeoxyribonuclease 7 large subunit n=1 Tax=Bifidobacterium pseudolongum subsp. globosum TaxID=1690 RepID=A0A2N3QZ54_9BIFI|nr:MULTISPECIES: exodeoxyribonuclease VII large subunit [Bifidobacterium]ATO39643.1 exodeoxyribonuclease VII large subunit [Bifidobacterium pseudolongum subsp. globosum DSM 20092]KFI77679.1 exodeoxyribonuclease VII large subunit [Bifidobacterium pseudolongum subsp. globosum]MBQ1600231.1 exodeoxyribonuclease VII large subunit [Bifidobacterium sp.]MCH4835664.1 exodeoxyribonuclease VII large subunit [Bifidobacterium pseudolongum]MEE1202262.1 exodeoxyribonuclease VII large subunit [Bifidobacterium
MVWNNNNGSGGAGSPLDRPRTADELPRFARDTTPENPWPVSLLSQHFHDAVERWPAAWIEGQIIEINARRTGTVYLTLRDSFQEVSISALGFGAFAQKARAFQQGDRVVMHGQADLWVKSTRLSFRADDIRRIGSGGIKEQIDELRKKLKGEGLFDESNKVPIPEFPTTIGIVCGPGARAEGDIITNVNLRWPIVNFAVKYAHVQGPQCPAEVVQAIQELDADPAVDVIIVARGGGSFEDLIGFSDERVVRATAACVTPIISAVGHEDDWTLIDLASDMRASTPTDAAKRVVPDVREQQQLVASAIGTMSMRMRAMVDNESRLIEGYVNRPSLTHPQTMVESHERDIADAVRAMRIGLTRIVDDAQMHVEKLKATLTALSPQSTLDRGYAVLQNASGHVVDDAGDVHVGDELTITLRHGTVVAQAQATHV